MGLKQLFNKGVQALGLAQKENHVYRLTDHNIPSLFFGRFGTTTPEWLQFRTTEDYAQAWNRCPPLVSILIRKAQADINGKVSFYKRDTEEPLKVPYNPTAKKLKKLFGRPNPLQTWRQFRTQQKIYQGLFGFCPVLMVKPAGFLDPMETTQMWNLPPWCVEIKTTGKYIRAQKPEDVIEKILFKYNNSSTELPIADVIFLNDSTISLSNQIVSDSRIKALAYPISNIEAACEALNVIIKKRGALGILANRDKDHSGEKVAIPKSEQEKLQKDFQQYGLTHQQSQIIITSANLDFVTMSMKISELMLPETIQLSTQEIADGYGYPYELLGNTKGVSFANKKEAKMTLYQDTIIPEAAGDFEVYNEYFKLTATDVELYYDFDHVEALQISAVEKSKALKTNSEAYKSQYEGGAITLNKYRELLNQPTREGDDVYYYETEQYKAAAQAQQQNSENKTKPEDK